jgi:hypothetical protein
VFLMNMLGRDVGYATGRYDWLLVVVCATLFCCCFL